MRPIIAPARGTSLAFLLLLALQQAASGPTDLRSVEIHATDSPGSFTRRALTAAAGHRLLKSSEDDCEASLMYNLIPLQQECTTLAHAMQGIMSQRSCTSGFDFSSDKIEAVCSSACYPVVLSALEAMSRAGCSSAAFVKNMCDQCPPGTVCVDGACRDKCSTSLPCACNATCLSGSCEPKSQFGVQRAELGPYGYKVTLENLCFKPASGADPCLTQVYAAMSESNNNITRACAGLAKTGCCAGTVTDFTTRCALANETVTTVFGPVKISDLEAFCPAVNFKSRCSSAPAFSNGSCDAGYVDQPAKDLPGRLDELLSPYFNLLSSVG